MKKLVVCLCVVAMVFAMMAPAVQAADHQPGGFMGFLVGCLFGLRTGTEYNEGKNVHWREWITLVPGVCIWNGIDCAKGMTAHEFSTKYGANWY